MMNETKRSLSASDGVSGCLHTRRMRYSADNVVNDFIWLYVVISARQGRYGRR
jgi:hypothetical protein